jgi:hypothetical protein
VGHSKLSRKKARNLERFSLLGGFCNTPSRRAAWIFHDRLCRQHLLSGTRSEFCGRAFRSTGRSFGGSFHLRAQFRLLPPELRFFWQFIAQDERSHFCH